MEAVSSLLPLGSVIRVAGPRRLVVVARALMLTVDSETALFDYGACVYPEGMVGDSMVYLNADDIVEVVHEGFTDDDDRRYLDLARELVTTTGVARGDTRRFRRLAAQELQRAVDRG